MNEIPKLHKVWMIFIVFILIWYSWFFRYSNDTDLFYLDRWTGYLVHPDNEPLPLPGIIFNRYED